MILTNSNISCLLLLSGTYKSDPRFRVTTRKENYLFFYHTDMITFMVYRVLYWCLDYFAFLFIDELTDEDE